MIRSNSRAFAAIFAFGFLLSFSGQLLAGQTEARIEEIITAIAAGNQPEIAGAKIGASKALPQLYQMRGFRPVWYGTGAEDRLLQQLGSGLDQGFRPADFHLPLLLELYDQARAGEPEDVAVFDIVASDAAARLIHHLIYGKVDADKMDPDWNFSRPVLTNHPVEVLNAYLEQDDFDGLIATLSISNPQYRELMTVLLHYRQIAAAGGWPMVPEGDVLKPDMTDARVPLLRSRLEVSGDFIGAASQSQIYDTDLVVAVKHFQSRHGLEVDGVIGGRSIVALNRTVAERIDQIRLSLERMRWLVRGLGDRYVLVNIAGARTYLVDNGKLVWSTRSITGTQYRKTPVFRDDIKYMEFNPTWTVPSSIFRKDKLSKIRKDPGYLDRNGYSVRNSDGAVVAASQVNWSAKNPSVTLVQKPGPNNALGLVKFMFPNKYAVYLHDTSNRTLFSRAGRNLSSGCVRLQDPFVFANLLMKDDPDWSEAKMSEILATGVTTRVNLPSPMPVLLTYFTAWVENGMVQFREDIYERDQKVLDALNSN